MMLVNIYLITDGLKAQGQSFPTEVFLSCKKMVGKHIKLKKMAGNHWDPRLKK